MSSRLRPLQDPSTHGQAEHDAWRLLYIAHHTTIGERLRWVEETLRLFAKQVVEDKKRRGLLPESYEWNDPQT
jgi:hypothetical protein